MKLRDRIQEYLQTLKPSDLIDATAYIGLMYYGYHVTKDIRGSLLGIIGYKLATTMGGTPPVSQIAGLSMLGALGVTAIAQNAPFNVEIPGTGIKIPQALPDPFQYTKEKFEEPGWTVATALR